MIGKKYLCIGPTRLHILGMVIEGHMRGDPPSIREIMKATGLRSPNAVTCNIVALRDAGLIEWNEHLARTMRPLVKFIPAERR